MLVGTIALSVVPKKIDTCRVLWHFAISVYIMAFCSFTIMAFCSFTIMAFCNFGIMAFCNFHLNFVNKQLNVCLPGPAPNTLL